MYICSVIKKQNKHKMEKITINNKNHKNLKSNVPFEELPKWFRDAKTENAEIKYINDYLTWYNGEWLDGEWLGTHWLGGNWYGGHWLSGHWHGGHWLGGHWHGGHWLSNINRPE